MRIGIYGGTFDPCTEAHVEIVKRALKDNLVDKVVVLPSIVEYYRKDKKSMFSNEEKKEILKRWFNEKDENIILDFHEYEISTNNKSLCAELLLNNRRYIDMLSDSIVRYGSENEYFTIIGMDSYQNIKTWHRWEEIVNLSKLIVVSRGGVKITSCVGVGPYIPEFVDSKFHYISASNIREFLIEKSKNTNISPFEIYMKMIDETKEKSEKVLTHTPIFDVVEGEEIEEGFKPIKIKSPEWVTVVVEKDGKFLMEKQLRYGLNKEFEEFPCGMIENNEQPITAALRELEEETGIKLNINDLTYLGKYAANPAFMTNYMHYFYVKPKTYDIVTKKLDEHEHLTEYWIDKDKAFENFLKSEGSAIMGCCWMLLLKNGILKL